MARIAIIGPGVIGSVVAAWLDQTRRHEVILCARRPRGELLLVPVMVDIRSERAADDRVRQRGPGRMVVPDGAAGRASWKIAKGAGK